MTVATTTMQLQPIVSAPTLNAIYLIDKKHKYSHSIVFRKPIIFMLNIKYMV